MALTRREKMLALLAHQGAECLSAFFVADNFNQPQPLPPGLGMDDPFDPGIMRFLGGDVVDRLALGPEVAREMVTTRYTTETLSDGSTRSTWETPLGRLTSLAQPSADGQTTFTVEFPVKCPQDYDLLKFILEDTRIVADGEKMRQEGLARLERVGNDGIIYTVVPCSPIMELTRTWTGLERFIYDYCDEPTRVRGVMESLHRLNCEHYELACRYTPGRVLVNWDDVNNLYISRRLFQEHWLPAMRDYAEICHRHGKLLVMHTCGKLRGLVDLFPASGIDAVDWLTPPPTGDVAFAEAQALFGGQITVMGAAEPGVMRFGTPDTVEANLHRWLAGVDLCRGFILMIPCPLGTPLANAARVAKVLARDYGLELNVNPDYWPLWEDPAAAW